MQAITLKNDIRGWKVPVRDLDHFCVPANLSFFFFEPEALLKSYPTFLSMSRSHIGVFSKRNVRGKSAALIFMTFP